MKKSDLFKVILEECRDISAKNIDPNAIFYSTLSLRSVFQEFYGMECKEFEVISSYCRSDCHMESYHFCGPVRPDASAAV